MNPHAYWKHATKLAMHAEFEFCRHSGQVHAFSVCYYGGRGTFAHASMRLVKRKISVIPDCTNSHTRHFIASLYAWKRALLSPQHLSERGGRASTAHPVFA